MKKILLLISSALAFNASFAQLEPKKIVPSLQFDLGRSHTSSNTTNTFSFGNNNISTSSSSKANISGISFVPGCGFNLSGRVQIGAYVYLSNQQQKDIETAYTYKYVVKGFAFAPYGRVYLASTENLSFFAEGNITLSSSKGDNYYKDSTSSSFTKQTTISDEIKSFNFNIKPGAQYMIGNLGIDFSVCLFTLGTQKITTINYNNGNKFTNETKNGTSGILISPTPFTIGARYYF